MPYNGFTIEELLEEFKKDMYQKFVDHDDKWDNNSAIRHTWNFEDVFFIEKLREEVSYHYAKWLYRGVVKCDLPEEDTLTNMANMCFLLRARIIAEREHINHTHKLRNTILSKKDELSKEFEDAESFGKAFDSMLATIVSEPEIIELLVDLDEETLMKRVKILTSLTAMQKGFTMLSDNLSPEEKTMLKEWWGWE